MKFATKLLTILLSIAGSICEEAVPEGECCKQIFLQSSGLLADSQFPVLGIYTITSTKLANNPHPIYVKHGQSMDNHVYFRNKDNDPKGWIVGGELNEDSYHITTGQQTANCPEGIVGGFDMDNRTQYDKTFSIECHSDQVKIPCCENIELTATGAIKDKSGMILGKYKQVGDFNGYPRYKHENDGLELFYRKAGYGPDGWMVSPSLEQETIFVTTKEKVFCPDAITRGFLNDEEDSTVRATCLVEVDQDPGLPSEEGEDVAPLGDPQQGNGVSGSDQPRQGRQDGLLSSDSSSLATRGCFSPLSRFTVLCLCLIKLL